MTRAMLLAVVGWGLACAGAPADPEPPVDAPSAAPAPVQPVSGRRGRGDHERRTLRPLAEMPFRCGYHHQNAAGEEVAIELVTTDQLFVNLDGSNETLTWDGRTSENDSYKYEGAHAVVVTRDERAMTAEITVSGAAKSFTVPTRMTFEACGD